MTLSYWRLKRTADLLTVPRWNQMSHANYWAGSSMFINPLTLSYSVKTSSLYRWISWSIYRIWTDLNRLMSGLIWLCLMTLFRCSSIQRCPPLWRWKRWVLFTRFITYDTGRRDHKVYAWGTRLWLIFWKVSSQGKIWKTYELSFLLKINMRR